MCRARLAFLPAVLLATSIARADQDGVQAPYFVVSAGSEGADSLPLKDTRAAVNIAGVIAQVHVTQTYQNAGRAPLEAVYVFPGSTRAAVTGMKMTLGQRTIVAKIEKRQVARDLYETAKRNGQGASLLEQQRPNVFQMNVANILPGEDVVVELDYAELLIPTEGVYEFVCPAVVGPRYGSSTDRWIGNPYLPKGTPDPYRWDVSVHLEAGMPVAELQSPSHKIGSQFTGETMADVVIDNAEQDPGNRDFVLRYRLGSSAVHAGMLLFPGGDENFFLVMLQPPPRPTPETILPREYIFVVDVSGSMSGFPIETSKELLRHLVSGLRAEDRFNVLLFSGGNRLLSPAAWPPRR